MRLRTLSTAIATFVVSLPAFAAITGTVINADGQAVSGAQVSLFAPETLDARVARLLSKTPARTPLVAGTSDSRGNFSIDSPKEPVLDLRVDANGFAPEAERVLPDEELGAIPLFPAAMQKGTITAAGKPVAGALVVFSAGSSEYTATTDTAGHYSAPDPSRWANRMTVIHSDYAVLDENIGRFATKTGLDRSLEPGIPIKGRVVAADGTTPVANAPVFVDDRQLATTGQDGTFTLVHAAKNWTTLEVRVDDRAGVRAHAAGDVAIKMAKAATVTGIVTDAKTNVPLAGVEVRLFEGRGLGAATSSMRSAFTNAKGAYTLPAVPPGNYEINPMRPGYATPNVSVSVSAGQALQKSLYASPRGRILGSVVDDQKRAVAGARLAARPAARQQMAFMGIGGRNASMEAPAFSGPDGRFVLRSVVTESDIRVDAAKKGYPAGESATMKLAPAERKAGVLITIPRGIALTGKVVDHDGRPVSGVGVDAIEAQNDGGFGGVRRMVVNLMREDRNDEIVRTASDGTFTIRVKEGTYDVVFKRDGFATKTVRGEAINATTKPLSVTLDPGVEITGRVTRGGVGVEGVNVSAVGQDGMANTTTGPDGSFRLEDLTPGQVMLNAAKREEFIQQIRPITAPAQNVVIEVPPGGRVSGHVVDKSSHNPITSFQAGISTSRSAGGMFIQTPPILKPFTADDGSFTLENVPTGPAQIIVSAPGYTTAHVPGVNVQVDKPVDDLEVALDTGVRLTGRVTGPDGSPVAGVSVRPDTGANSGPFARGLAMTGDGGTVTDPNGEYTLDAIEPGDKTFTFSRQGYLTVSRTITLSSSSSRLDVQLSNGVPLTGTVISDTGTPIADAVVTASSASDSGFGGRQARTDANGGFEIDGLTPGHYRLTATKSGYATGILSDFDVASGAPARITIKSGGTITGHVTGLTPDEQQNATVIATGSNGSASAPVDGSGNYHIDGSPTGTVRVSARTGQMFGGGGKTSQQQSIEVDPGTAVTVNLEFKNATVITGHVTRDGQPLANAAIGFMPKGAQASTTASGQTDNSGNYQVTGLDDATYAVQIVDFQRTAPFSTSYTVKGSGTFDIDINSATLHGRVVDATTSQPIVNAQVQLRSTNTDAILSSRAAQTASDGSFTIDSVAPGNYEAKADSDGYGHQIQSIVVGDTNEDLEFKLSPSNGITLTVVDARDNSTLAAIVVRVVDAQGQNVDTMAGFRLGGTPEPVKLPLAVGTYRITVAAMNYATQTFDVISPSNPTLRMSPGGTLVIRSKSNTMTRARLVDANGLAYVRGFGAMGGGVFTIDPSPGVTTLQNVAPGSFTLQILGSGDQVVKSVPVNVIDGQQTPVEVD